MSLNIESTSALHSALAAGRDEFCTREVVFSGGEGDASGEWVAVLTIGKCSLSVDFRKRGQPVNVLSGGAIVRSNSNDIVTRTNMTGPSGALPICKVLPINVANFEQISISYNVSYETPHVRMVDSLCLNDKVDDDEFRSAYESLFSTGVESDLALMVEDMKIPVHKAILIARSPYFREMLTGLHPSVKYVKITDFRFYDVREVIKCLYCGLLPKNLGGEYAKYQPIAERFKMRHLLQACNYYGSLGFS